MTTRPSSVLFGIAAALAACSTGGDVPPPAGATSRMPFSSPYDGENPFEDDTEPAADPAPASVPTPISKPPAPELPFDPSPDDKAAFDVAGYTGVAKLPAGLGYAKGPRAFDVKPGGFAAAAGMKAGDVIVEFAGVSFPESDDDAIGSLRRRQNEIPFDTDVQVKVWREAEGVRELTVHLGRKPPSFANLDTPAEWFTRPGRPEVSKLIADAVALDHGEARYTDVVARNRKHLTKTDALRIRFTTEAHRDLAVNEALASAITDDVAGEPSCAAICSTFHPGHVHPKLSVGPDKLFEGLDLTTLDGVASAAERVVTQLDARCRAALSSWTPADRELVKTEFHQLTERVNQNEYLYDDEVVARERANRRLVKLFAQVKRGDIDVARYELRALLEKIAAVAKADGREGRLVSRETPVGRIEIWGRGNTRHTDRCAFRFDLGGNDDWLDCAGRADLDQPVCISIDWSGNDTYGGTSPFDQGGALGGVGVLWDHEGDDQYLARTWSQGCGVAGYGLLQDDGGRDVYHGQDECQGIGLAGAGVLHDDGKEDDIYTGDRFCQGVGFAGGVGALVDTSGNDRYVCTGKYDSEYGEPGLFSGWGQGVGMGFRGIASGGIGILYDLAGDDVYEAGNFSQGGGYFYAWGILRDDEGNDRYIGSRYAQGFAAHQAVGTFLEGGGNDLYQCHSSVANGISWDETSVLFHDRSGDDVYERSGAWLAGAAQNGMVLFLDDAGNDRYEAPPGHAKSNEYHGGHSFALFVDRGGEDVYGTEKASDWNDRVFWRDEGAYQLDLPLSPKALGTYVR